MLTAHQSYLRWKCQSCSYLTSTHRRFDHKKHWEKKHFGPAQPPAPSLVKKEQEDQRREDERRRREERSASRANRSSGTRVSPRKPQPPFEKRTRHSSSPASRTTPVAKRGASSSAGRGRAPEAAAGAPQSHSPSHRSPSQPRDLRFQLDDRQSRGTQRAVRRRNEPQATSEDAAAPETSSSVPATAPPPPVPSTSHAQTSPSSLSSDQQDVQVLLHDQGGEFEEEDEQFTGATGGSPRPGQRTDTPVQMADLPSLFNVSLRWIHESASLEECRAIGRACEEREAALLGQSPPRALEARAAPAPHLGHPAPPAAVPAPHPVAQPAEFVWRPGPGMSVRVVCRTDDFVE